MSWIEYNEMIIFWVRVVFRVYCKYVYISVVEIGWADGSPKLTLKGVEHPDFKKKA